MDFFSIGPGEIFLVVIVALLIFGPGKIVEVSRTLGRIMYTIRKASGDFTNQLSQEWEEEKRTPPPAATEAGEKPAPPEAKTEPPHEQ